MLVECFTISVQMRGGKIFGMMLHQPLSAAGPISDNTYLFCSDIAPADTADVLTTGYAVGALVGVSTTAGSETLLFSKWFIAVA